MKTARIDQANGFTLIELLVAIVIIGVVASLLLPALAQAKMKAAQAACLNNHRQMALGWQLYSNDHDDSLPWTVDDGDGIKGFTNWVSGNMREPNESKNTELLIDPKRSQLAAYVSQAKVYKCPSDSSPFVRSVSMNNRLNPVRFLKKPLVLGGYGTNFLIYRKISDIRATQRVFVLLDERNDSINEGNFAVDLSNTGSFTGEGAPNPYWWIDTPASYHRRGVNLSFADLHVERHGWMERTTLGPLGVTGPRRTSDNDKDISWLQYRTAERVAE